MADTPRGVAVSPATVEETETREPVGREHELKCWPEYFEQHLNGAKTFELRRWDRPFCEGDVLVLNEYDAPRGLGYTGRTIRRKVTSMVAIPYAENLAWDRNRPNGGPYVVMGLAALRTPERQQGWRERAATAVENLAAAMAYQAGLGVGEWESFIDATLNFIGESERLRIKSANLQPIALPAPPTESESRPSEETRK